MQNPPIEVRDDKGVLIGMRCMVRGVVKYVPIHLNVVAALRAFREAMKIEEPPYSEPVWDEELTEEEDKALMGLEGLTHYHVKQVF